MYQYSLVVCGGTFDHFHKGHEQFLTFCFSRSQRVLIGLTSDSFIQQKSFSKALEPYSIRKHSLEYFLKQKHYQNRVDILAIDTVHIPDKWGTLPIEAIIVSKNSIAGANAINAKRRAQGSELALVISPMLSADDGDVISSSRIREGLINRDGRRFIQPAWLQEKLVLPDILRKTLKQPFGKLLKEFVVETRADLQNLSRTITVGDVITETVRHKGFIPFLSIIDFAIERRKNVRTLSDFQIKNNEEVIHAKNPSGTLTCELFTEVSKIFRQAKKQTYLLIIEGEEDLAVLPVLLSSPLGYYVYYGQPKEGVVCIRVTEQSKEKAYKIVQGFISKPR